MLTAPAARALRERFPSADIRMLVKPQFAQAAAANPALSGVLTFSSFSSSAAEINALNFDVIADLHATLRTRLLCALCRAPRKLRYRKDSLARRLFVSFRFPSPALQRHTLDRYMAALEPLGVKGGAHAPALGDWNSAAVDGTGTPCRMVSRYRRILLMQGAFLGDCVLTLPLLKQLRALFPSAAVSVLARPETAGVFAQADPSAAIIEDRKRSSSFFAEFFRLKRELRKGAFDLAVIPHRSLRSALLARLAGIPRRVGFSSSAGAFLLTDRVPFSWLLHDLERNLTLLLPLKGTPEPVWPGLSSPPDPFKKFGLPDRGLFGVNPGSAWPTKCWPAARYAGVIKRLHKERGLRAVLVGGPKEREVAGEVERLAGPGTCFNLAGRTDLGELMAVIRRMSLFITNDSGPMHIAAAYGVPTAAVFGPTTRELGFFPYGEKNEVLEEFLECRPCALHGSRSCPRGHFLCMKLITADKVHAAAVRLLKRPGPAGGHE
ncbi:MAG: lipopolysaccharide heptosyltransferase II [Elusimicrobia bacterium]|nr:MAG: lipopolysaccharide heptosyltransferase II [Elusimicrobiota bacterium]KAF0156602.1 MAG: lipopolysaccharide heptosyltransferase II [Elusimicrobiota bacterium]